MGRIGGGYADAVEQNINMSWLLSLCFIYVDAHHVSQAMEFFAI